MRVVKEDINNILVSGKNLLNIIGDVLDISSANNDSDNLYSSIPFSLKCSINKLSTLKPRCSVAFLYKNTTENCIQPTILS